MGASKILDAFFEQLQELTQRDDAADASLRWTGEQLALASDRLARAAAAERTERSAELLVIAHAHVEALSAAGMAPDALATQTMAMLTVLNARVSPEEFPTLWLQSLQELCIKASEFVYSASGPQMPQASQLVAQTFGLFIATAHSYIPRYGASEPMKRFYEHMRHQAAQAGEDTSHFRGHLIVPTLAIDVLSDNAARLAAMGAME